MVEHGIVKKFFGADSHNKGMYGFIHLLDENGNKTGENLFFHLNAGRRLKVAKSWNFYVTFTKKLAVMQEPRAGDRIVFERGTDKSGRSRANAWTYQRVWDAEEAQFTTERELTWRIVLKGYEATGIIHFAGTVDETGSEYVLETSRSGIRQGSLCDACRWTAKDLEFYDPYDDAARQGYDRYAYYLQVKQENGKWLQLKGINPIPEPDEPDDWYHEDPDDEIDPVSLAEIQHGLAHEMY